MRKNTFLKWVLIVLVVFSGIGSSYGQYSGSGTFTKITALDQLTDGYYVVVNSGDGFAMNNTNAGTYFAHTAVTPVSSVITNPATSLVWKIQTHVDGGKTIYNEASLKYVSYTGTANAAQAVDAVTSGAQRWNFTYASNVFTVANAATTTRILQYNSSSPRFACYTSAQQKLLLYKMDVAVNPTTVADPLISASGVEKSTDNYFETAQISLTSTTADASIYYTLNGDEPTTASTLYNAPFNITSSKTIKAIGVKDGFTSSAVVTKVITISAPAVGTAPYAEAFNNTLGDWYGIAVSGTKPWLATVNGAYANGYNGGTVESWLISPRFTVDADGLEVSFNYASKYMGNSLVVKASTNYAGYGSPSSATWVDLATILAPSVQDDAYTVKYSGKLPFTTVGNVHFALYYAASSSWSDWRITNVSVAEPTLSPTILVTELSIPAMSSQINLTDTETFTVNGSNLTGDVTLNITGTDASLFTLSASAITPTSGSVVDQVITVTYSPVSAGTHSATLTLSASGAENVTRTLNGTATNPPVTPDVIITEVYGGGGNSGATLKNDFVELYNTTESSVSIAGWSIQYYSATATGISTNVFEIPAGKYIPAKNYFLVQCAAGTGGTENLLAPDAVSILNLSGSAGKIILYTTNSPQTITTDVTSITGNVSFKDYVPYGTTAIPVLGTVSAAPSNTTSLSRKMASSAYLYTQNIANDFEVITPAPQSSGLTTGLSIFETEKIQIVDGKIFIHAVLGQTIEVFNAVGQRLLLHKSTAGLNVLDPQAKGLIIIKSDNQIIKLIL